MKHLSPSYRHALALRLVQMRDQVLDELRQARPGLALDEISQSTDVHSNADQAEARRMDDVRFAEIEIDRGRLKDIERARQRMAEGRYGICSDCGEGIPVERLLTLPTAVRCASCQAQAESR